MILVCGEIVLDILTEPGAPTSDHVAHFAGHPGGSPANTAVALARLGTHAGMCARLAAGGVGPLLREHLRSNGVDLRYCVTAPEPASLAFVDVGPDGAASYTFYVTGTADWQWAPGELPTDLGDEVRAVHVGSIAASVPPGRETIAAWLRSVHAGRMVSFDPNVRPRLLGDVTGARRWIEGLLGTVDLVKVSDEDLAWLYPGSRPDDVAARWRELGPAVVVVTLGAEGARGFAGGDPVARPARVVQVADTVGAGDSYAAGLLHWLDGAHLTGAVASGRLSDGELGSALDYAAGVASITCSRAGADPPRAAEVDEVLGGPGPQVGRTR